MHLETKTDEVINRALKVFPYLLGLYFSCNGVLKDEISDAYFDFQQLIFKSLILQNITKIYEPYFCDFIISNDIFSFWLLFLTIVLHIYLSDFFYFTFTLLVCDEFMSKPPQC